MKQTKRTYRVYLEDILAAIARIREYTAGGRDAFFRDTLVQDGVIRQLSIVGEAASKLSAPMKAKHKEIPWKKVIGMRNVIIHDYSVIKLERIWETVEEDLLPLQETVEAMLKETAA